MSAHTTLLKRLREAYVTAAELVLLDPKFTPIFERIERELKDAERVDDVTARARAVMAAHKAKG